MLTNADHRQAKTIRKILRGIEATGKCYNIECGTLWMGEEKNYQYNVDKYGLTCDVPEEDIMSDDLTDGEILCVDIL